jgi:hypothetical protein
MKPCLIVSSASDRADFRHIGVQQDGDVPYFALTAGALFH